MTAFKKQILLGVILVILANILAFALHQGLFTNIAWVIYCLLYTSPDPQRLPPGDPSAPFSRARNTPHPGAV